MSPLFDDDDDGFGDGPEHDGGAGQDASHPWFGALQAGTAYALYRHGQDAQTASLITEMRTLAESLEARTAQGDVTGVIAPVNAHDFSRADAPRGWELFIGQEPMKSRLATHVRSALARGTALPHVLLGSQQAGMGRTSMGRLIAHEMGGRVFELAPHFSVEGLVAAASSLGSRDVLLLDDLDRFATPGSLMAEVLVKVIDDRVGYLPRGGVIRLPEFSIVATSSNLDALPPYLVDRFLISLSFQPYSELELARLAIDFAARYGVMDDLSNDMAVAIAKGCLGPRAVEAGVLAFRDLAVANGPPPTQQDFSDFLGG